MRVSRFKPGDKVFVHKPEGGILRGSVCEDVFKNAVGLMQPILLGSDNSAVHWLHESVLSLAPTSKLIRKFNLDGKV